MDNHDVADLPEKRGLDASYSLVRYQNLAACQEVVIKWLCHFTQTETPQHRDSHSAQYVS